MASRSPSSASVASGSATRAACDRCHGLKARCRREKGTRTCERCAKVSMPCNYSAPSRMGRPKSTRSNEPSLRGAATSKYVARRSPGTDQGGCLQEPGHRMLGTCAGSANSPWSLQTPSESDWSSWGNNYRGQTQLVQESRTTGFSPPAQQEDSDGFLHATGITGTSHLHAQPMTATAWAEVVDGWNMGSWLARQPSGPEFPVDSTSTNGPGFIAAINRMSSATCSSALSDTPQLSVGPATPVSANLAHSQGSPALDFQVDRRESTVDSPGFTPTLHSSPNSTQLLQKLSDIQTQLQPLTNVAITSSERSLSPKFDPDQDGTDWSRLLSSEDDSRVAQGHALYDKTLHIEHNTEEIIALTEGFIQLLSTEQRWSGETLNPIDHANPGELYNAPDAVSLSRRVTLTNASLSHKDKMSAPTAIDPSPIRRMDVAAMFTVLACYTQFLDIYIALVSSLFSHVRQDRLAADRLGNVKASNDSKITPDAGLAQERAASSMGMPIFHIGDITIAGSTGVSLMTHLIERMLDRLDAAMRQILDDKIDQSSRKRRVDEHEPCDPQIVGDRQDVRRGKSLRRASHRIESLKEHDDRESDVGRYGSRQSPMTQIAAVTLTGVSEKERELRRAVRAVKNSLHLDLI